jgi:hypothetical protein
VGASSGPYISFTTYPEIVTDSGSTAAAVCAADAAGTGLERETDGFCTVLMLTW